LVIVCLLFKLANASDLRFAGRARWDGRQAMLLLARRRWRKALASQGRPGTILTRSRAARTHHAIMLGS
jgi:hypothetical protein